MKGYAEIIIDSYNNLKTWLIALVRGNLVDVGLILCNCFNKIIVRLLARRQWCFLLGSNAHGKVTKCKIFVECRICDELIQAQIVLPLEGEAEKHPWACIQVIIVWFFYGVVLSCIRPFHCGPI